MSERERAGEKERERERAEERKREIERARESERTRERETCEPGVEELFSWGTKGERGPATSTYLCRHNARLINIFGSLSIRPAPLRVFFFRIAGCFPPTVGFVPDTTVDGLRPLKAHSGICTGTQNYFGF